MKHFSVIRGTLRAVTRESRRSMWLVILFYGLVYLMTFAFTVAVQRLLAYAGNVGSVGTEIALFAWMIFLSYIGVRMIGPSNILLFNFLQRDVGVKLMRKAYDQVGKIPHQEFVVAKSAGRIQRIMMLAQDSTLTQYAVHAVSCAAALICLLALSVVYRQYWYFTLVIVAFNLLSFLLTSKEGLMKWKLRQAQADDARKTGRYRELFLNRDALTEMRALGGEEFVFGQYARLQKDMWRHEEGLERRLALRRLLSGALQYSTLLMILVLGTGMVMRGRIDAALFAWFFVLRNQIDQTCRNLLGELNMVWQGMPDAAELLNFLEQQQAEAGEKLCQEGEPGAIEMRHVCFSYQDTQETFALRDASLSIRPGEKVMVLGLNGSGKTTLIKNMIGLFTPQSGSVCVGGKGADSIGIVWQDFMKYSFTLRDNIAFGCVDRMDDESLIQAAAAQADVNQDIRRDLGRYATKLFSDDGIDLSGGQWQQVAMARGLIGSKPVVVLDEPTAMMDPLREQRTFSQLLEKLPGQTVVFVSHRMGFARFVDKVVVLDQGRIIQAGRHEELIRQPGRYRELYEAQAKWYREDEKDA